MSQGEDRTVKVTITIEDSETIRTIEIPRAREIDVHYAPQPTSLEDRPLLREEMTSGWDIRGIADYDYESKRIIITSSRPKTIVPEVENVWKHLSSYDIDGFYAEINEFGDVRVNDNIYKPLYDANNKDWVIVLSGPNDEEIEISPIYFVKVYFNKDLILTEWDLGE